MKKTLLEKAKEIKIRRQLKGYTNEEIELAIAWLTDEISLGQFTKVMWNTTTSASGGKGLYTIAVMLRDGYHKGLLTIK